MNFKYSLIVLFFIFNTKVALAQKDKKCTIEFYPVFGNVVLHLDESYYKLSKSDSIQIETLKFYISGIELINNNKTVWKEKNSFHLIDVSNEKSLQVSFKLPTDISFNKIKFNLGIDSATNVSGAMGGDLDPTKGMYWTWQSGYVNFKLEGKSNLCKTRNNVFQFHLGGYLSPFYALQVLTLDVTGKEKTDILADISKLISVLDLSKQNEIMSPGKDAVLIAEKALKIFSIK